MTRPVAVIFDMDGVLVDSEPIHCEIERKIFNKLEIAVPAALHHSYMGTSCEFMYQDLILRYQLKATVEELIALDELFRYDYFKQIGEIHPNCGIPGFLAGLKSEGLKLAVATSSSPRIARLILDRCNIISFFDTVVTANERAKSKPEPDVFLLAAHQLGAPPQNIIVFEDSPNGLKAAKKAGMFCVVMQQNKQILNELSAADYHISSFVEITPATLFGIFSGDL